MSNVTIANMTEKIQSEIGKTWRGGGEGKGSILLAIPKNMKYQYHLEDPTNIIFIPTEQGILIKKLEVAK